MTRQTRHIILFAILVLLSFTVWQYYFYSEQARKDKPFTKGYSVEDIELRIISENGEMSAKFISPSLIKYTDSPIIHIDLPIFWTYKQGAKQWKITAKNAEYNATTNEVELQNNLIAKTVNKEASTSFEANNLLVNLDTKFAHTGDGISFKQQQLDMQGQIAKFDLTNEILEVNNNVKAIYKTIH